MSPGENDNARMAAGAGETGLDNDRKSTPSRGIRQQSKRAIVGAACWGLLPAGFASWLIRIGGLRHE